MKLKKLLVVGMFISTSAFAQTNQELALQLKQVSSAIGELKALVSKQQAQIQILQNENMQLKAVPNSKVVSNSNVEIAPMQKRAASAQYLPDIGFIADIVGSATKSREDEEGNDRISVREVELVLGHDVDPYSRLDAVITFSDLEEPDIEEAYLTHFGLPYGVKGRFGRMHQKIGKASATHRDTLDTVDEPFVVANFLGVEGYFKSGADFSGFLPWSGDRFTQELTLGVNEGGVGEDGTLFGESRRRPTFYGHLTNFYQISDQSNAELGFTYLHGSKDEDSKYEVKALGVDATFIHHLNAINKIKLQAEGFFQNRKESFGFDQDDNLIDYKHNPWGAYLLADYRLNQKFGTGLRYDYLEPTENDPANPRGEDRGLSAYLTYYQSEFARWRVQYQRAELADGLDDDRFFLQGTFAIGTHKHAIN